uniref:Uncharacterized protein n=1 Tax=Triticum urartu TaxID=4572 RepID=A0A8R7QEU7_TRIUA
MCRRISSASSSQGSSWKKATRWRTTTSRRSPRFTSCSASTAAGAAPARGEPTHQSSPTSFSSPSSTGSVSSSAASKPLNRCLPLVWSSSCMCCLKVLCTPSRQVCQLPQEEMWPLQREFMMFGFKVNVPSQLTSVLHQSDADRDN